MANELKRSQYNRTDSDVVSQISPRNLQYLTKYEQDMTIRELSPGSIYQYKRDIIKFLAYVCENQFNQDVADLTSDDIEEFIYWQKQAGNNTERIKRLLSSISGLYNYMKRKKLVEQNPVDEILRPKRGLPVVVQTYLTPEQVDELIRKLKAYGNLQLLLYVKLSLSTMGRVNAIASIQWSQIDYENLTVHDVLEKEGYIVDLFFDEETGDLLKQLQQRREEQKVDCPYVFMSQFKQGVSVEMLTLWAKRAGELIGIHTLHPHDFRHSTANILYSRGAPLELVSELLNHRGSLDTAKNYYVKQNTKRLRENRDKYMYATVEPKDSSVENLTDSDSEISLNETLNTDNPA